ncbi:MAG TPA: serine hydrolase [Thermomicrobiales bacterium]|nr:serine hydrolase [Thermomicrobiales bacterium]
MQPVTTGRKHGRQLRLLLLATLVVSLVTLSLPATAVEAPSPPEVFAENAVVLSDFNEVLYDHNAHQRTAMASTTKIMTAILAVRYGNLDQDVLIDESDIVGEASMGLYAGETVKLRDLLYGLLLPSGNDAAHAIARTVGWKPGTTTADEAVNNFVGLMNQTASEYQLRDTHFMNPHGLDAWGHYSTPFDLAIMLRAALNYDVIRETMQTLSINAGGHDLWNHNQLYGMRDDMIGGKTGYTEAANFCLAAAAGRNGRFVIAVVTRDDGDNWVYDVSQLLDWGLIAVDRQGIPPGVNPNLIGTQLNQPDPVIQQGSP